MKKRLRKKLHRGEFSEQAINVIAHGELGADDTYVDEWIAWVEARGLYVCGGFGPASADFAIDGIKTADAADVAAEVAAQLHDDPRVTAFGVSEPFDPWVPPDRIPQLRTKPR